MRTPRLGRVLLAVLLAAPALAMAQDAATWGAYARLAGSTWRSSYPTPELVSTFAFSADGKSLTRTTLHGKQLSIYEVETLAPAGPGGLEGIIRKHDGTSVPSTVKLQGDGRATHEAAGIRVTLAPGANDSVAQTACLGSTAAGCIEAVLQKVPADEAAQLAAIRAKWPIMFDLAGRIIRDEKWAQTGRFGWVEPGRVMRETWHQGNGRSDFILTLLPDGSLERRVENPGSVLQHGAWTGRRRDDGGLEWLSPGPFGGTVTRTYVPGPDSHTAIVLNGRQYPYKVISQSRYEDLVSMERSGAAVRPESASPVHMDAAFARIRRSLLDGALQSGGAAAVAAAPGSAPATPVSLATQDAAAAQEAPRLEAAIASTGRRRALVIGNNDYRNVPRLANAKADAQAIAASLGRLGFAVTLRTDLDERGFKQALRTFRAEIQGGDEVVVYFAGHGVQLGGANFLLPVDIRGDGEDQVRDEALPLQRVLDDLAERRAGFMLAIVDACRDNPFKVAGRSIGGRGLAPSTAATGQMVIFSAGSGQQALDKLGPQDKSPNGLFTRVFLQEMEKAEQPVDRVLRNVRSEVVRLARTVGHDQTPALYDQTVGDFYLRKAR